MYSPILSAHPLPIATMSMSLVKIPFIMIDAFCMHVNGKPPNGHKTPCEIVIPDWREQFLRSLALPARFLRTMYYAVSFIEVLVIVTSQFPTNALSNHILTLCTLNHASTSYLIRVTPLFVLGNMIGIFGTILRVQSFRTLGCLFTFELCILENHRLVVDGPYAYLRHPSYTGLILTIIGYFLNHASGSWLMECGLLDTIVGKLMICVWSTIACAVILSLLLRVSREDGLLWMNFGVEWEMWAQRVPYKLLPGVY